MSLPEPALDVHEALERIPALTLLSEDVRRLVEASFESVTYSLGDEIVREGDPADAFYVLVDGSARVVKRTPTGQEVALNVLHGGDTFGEMALIADTTRIATVRARSRVEALRLDRHVFSALTRLHPEVRTTFAAIGNQRALWNFLRVQSSFSRLPNEALALLCSKIERVEIQAGDVVMRQGDPPGPMYVIETGRARSRRAGEDGEDDLGFFRTGDFFGERSLFLAEPRAATIEAVTDCVLLRLDPDLFRRLLADHPEFRDRLEQRIRQYDYQRLARVPLDFAEEILPAEAAAFEAVRDRGEATATEPLDSADALDYDGDGQPAGHKQIRRFPHVYQLDEMDCGAASLAIVCRYFGRAVSISRIRAAVHTSTDGTSLAGITRGAEELGLEARAVRASKSKLDRLPLPAIVHWEGNHWLVLYSVDDGRVRVSDPARGLRKFSRDEFLEKWSGYASLLAPTERFAETPESKSSLGWLKPFIRPHLRGIAVAFVLASIVAGLTLVLPILTQVVVDQVLPDKNLNLLYVVLAALGGVLLVMTGAILLERYLLARVAVAFDVSTLDFVTGKLLDLPMSYFNARRTGDIERRLQGVRQVREFLVQSGVTALTSITQLVAGLVLMFVYSWTLALVYLATVPLYVWLMRFSATRLRPMYDNLEDAYGKYQSAQIDAIKGIETVKAAAAEQVFRSYMLRQFQSLADRVFRSQFLVMTYQGGLQLVSFLSLGLFLFVGAYQVVDGKLTLGQFVSFNALVALADTALLLLLVLWDQLQLAQILLGRLDDVLDNEPEQGADHSGLRAVTTLAGAVELRNLGFRYGGPESPPILEGINLKVEPGEAVAIVGRSGSGKTTLIKLLAGLIEPTEGTIAYDGLELHTLDYRTLRRQVGFVLQESYLFDATIGENIAFGDGDVDPERIAWAARAANAHEFVQRLPLGYETKVGEAGMKLSGGQQQRIAIARALYHRPPILLFDEATSSLDTESERAVKESLDELLTGRTSFVIAHRLSTIRDADRIIVLERGRLVEEGTHDELMARQGLYFYLASQQLEL